MNYNKSFTKIFEKSFLSREYYPISMVFFGFILSFFLFYFFLSNKVYLIGSDAFYYMSIADSILKYGEMRDITSIPSFPVKTPQNGIVFVHLILSLLGLGAKDRILSIVLINYLLYLSGVYPLYKIARLLNNKWGFSLATLLSVYIAAWHIIRINLLAINDGIYNSLIIWLVYMIIKYVHDFDAGNLFAKKNLISMLIINFIVIVLIQFRLTASLIIASAVLSAFAIRDYKISASFLIVCLLLIFSFLSVYLFIPVVGFNNIIEKITVFMFKSIDLYYIKFQFWKVLPGLVMGLSPLSNPIATFMFIILPLSMIYYLFKGIKEKIFQRVFIACICLSGLWFTYSYPGNSRDILYTFPFVYLILLSLKRIKYIGYIFVFIVFLQGLKLPFTGFGRGPGSKLFLHIYENEISISDEALLISRERRHPYFFLGTRTYLGADNWKIILEKIKAPGKFIPSLTLDLIKNNHSIFVLGNNEYIDSIFSDLNEIAVSNDFELEYNPITPNLKEFEGWALVELKLKKSNKN